MAIFVKEILYHSSEYEALLNLRKKLIYRPWNIDFTADHRYRDSGTNLFGLYRDDKLIGSLLIRKINSETCEIKDLAIDYSAQHIGHGKSLVAFAEQWIGNKGYQQVELYARTALKPFFKALGYKQDGTNPDKLKPLTLKFVKDLTASEEINTNPAPPLYKETQDLPIGIVAKDGDMIHLFRELRLKFPKEDFLYFDVSKDMEIPDEDLHYGIQKYLSQHSKLILLSPLLPVYKYIGFRQSYLLDTTVALAKAAIEASEQKSILVLSADDQRQAKLYKQIFNILDSSVYVKIVPFKPDIERTEDLLDYDFYNDLEVLKAQLIDEDKLFDTVLYFDMSLYEKHPLLQDTLFEHYKENFNLIDPVQTLSKDVRSTMIRENLRAVYNDFGELKIISNVPHLTQLELEEYLSVEGPLPIEKL